MCEKNAADLEAAETHQNDSYNLIIAANCIRFSFDISALMKYTFTDN